jgi:hypothetical protein
MMELGEMMRIREVPQGLEQGYRNTTRLQGDGKEGLGEEYLQPV